MSEFSLLREAVQDLASRSTPPEFAELERRAGRRGRRRAVLVAGAVASIAVGGGLAAANLGGSDQLSTIGEPDTGSSASPVVRKSAEPPASLLAFGEALDAILEQVPGIASAGGPRPSDYDYAFNGPCSANWSAGATGGGDGGSAYSTHADGIGHAGFATAAQASTAAATFVESLRTCTATAWQTQAIAGTGGVLATSADAVVWIQRTGDTVNVLQVRTTDGSPPVEVQVKIAEWIASYHSWQELHH